MPRVKRTEAILKGGTNQLEIAEEWNQDIIVEHGEKLRDLLIQLDRQCAAARLTWELTITFRNLFGSSILES